jgi:threonine dehydratase
MLTLDAICQAQLRLRGLLHRTPMVRSRAVSDYLGADVFLKLECFQKTGSFKPRGAFNKLLSLSETDRKQGVVAVSGGNHAQGVAYAAQQLRVSATIVMPETTPRNYLDATRGYGADIVLTRDIAAAFAEAERLRGLGKAMVHPFDDPLVAAGQGTLGLEILEDVPDVSRVYISIGGGGLIAGMARALKTIKPDVRVFGVETHGADAMAQAVKAGKLVQLPAITSIARTLGAPCVSQFTLDSVREFVEEVLVVDDAVTMAALLFLLERTKVLTEPAGSCVLAAAARHRGAFRPGEKVVLFLCGGNIAAADLARFQQQFAGGRLP